MTNAHFFVSYELTTLIDCHTGYIFDLAILSAFTKGAKRVSYWANEWAHVSICMKTCWWIFILWMEICKNSWIRIYNAFVVVLIELILIRPKKTTKLKSRRQKSRIHNISKLNVLIIANTHTNTHSLSQMDEEKYHHLQTNN